MKTPVTALVAVALTLILFGGLAAAQALPSALRVAVDPAEPWKMVDAEGRPYGAEIDLFEALAAKLGVKVEYQPLPFARALAYMEDGRVDLMSGLVKTPERAAFLRYLEPPYKTRSDKAFYALKSSGVALDRYEDLRAYEVGVKAGVKLFPRFDADSSLRKVEGPAFDQLVLMLDKGRFQVLAVTEAVGDYWIHELGMQDRIAKLAYRFTTETPVHICVSRKSPFMARAAELDAALGALVRTGELDAVFRRFFAGRPLPAYR